MQDFHKMYGLKTVVFRHSSMYGGDNLPPVIKGGLDGFAKKHYRSNADNYRNQLQFQAMENKVRDILYASDMVDLYLSAADKIEEISGEVFNIGGGFDNSLSLLELFEVLQNELDIEMIYQQLEWRESDQKIFIADISKIKGANKLGSAN